MGLNRRYEAHYDALSEEHRRGRDAQNHTITLPMDAYGPQPLERPAGRAPRVWEWVSWRDGPATRIAAVATAWNDRVVIVEWEAPGGRRSVVVWRNAVSVRRE